MPRLLHAYSAALETEANALRERLLTVLASANVRPEIAALAMADILACQAASADLDFGQPRSLEGRLDVFLQRVEQTYKKSYPEMSARRVRARESTAGALQ